MDQPITIDAANKQTESEIVKLYFDPRKWSFNKTCKDNVGNRSFITGPDGVLAEGYMIGDCFGNPAFAEEYGLQLYLLAKRRRK